jgi:hypothetical protein
MPDGFFRHGFGLELNQGAFDHLRRHFHRETPFDWARTCSAGQSPHLIDLASLPRSQMARMRKTQRLQERAPVPSLRQTKGAAIGFTLDARVFGAGTKAPLISPIWHGQRSLAVSPRIAATLA